MSNTAMANNSRSGQRTAGRGTSHLSNSLSNIKPVPATNQRRGEIGRVVNLFLDVKGCKVEPVGHVPLMAGWFGLSPEGKVEAGLQIAEAIMAELEKKVIRMTPMLDSAQPLDLRIKTAQRTMVELDALEKWEELNLFAAPWASRRWGTADDGIGALLTWIAEQQHQLAKSCPKLREFLAKHPA